MMRYVGLVVVAALCVPGMALAGTGTVVEDNVGVLKAPNDQALEVVRLGHKREVQVGKVDGPYVQVRLTVTRGRDQVDITGWMEGRFVRLEDGSMASNDVVDTWGDDSGSATASTEQGWGAESESTDAGWGTETASTDTGDQGWGAWDDGGSNTETADAGWSGAATEDESADEWSDDSDPFADDSTESFFDDDSSDSFSDDSATSSSEDEPSWFE